MQDKKEMALNYFCKGYSDAEICKVLEISYHNLREWKSTVEWNAALETWKEHQAKHAKAKLLSNTDFIIDNAVKLIRLKETPANVKADLIKYLGNRVWGDTSIVELSKVKGEVKTDTDPDTVSTVKDTLETIKEKYNKKRE